MDIVLALLPWKFLWTATLYKREKIGALVAMSAGVISGIITFLKILVLPEISDENCKCSISLLFIITLSSHI